jgi:putative ABC transport system permease protein
MIKNLASVAIRHLKKNKLNTWINIFGLGIGIACSILSFFFIQNEISFDRFHKNLDTVYEVKMVLVLPMGRAVAEPRTSLAPDLESQFPEVIRAVRLEKKSLVVKHENTISEEQAMVADPSFFDMFTFPLKYGDTSNVFRSPSSAVLNESTAQKYFGSEDPVGKIISIRVGDRFSDFLITGVLKEIPSASSLRFDLILNLDGVYGHSETDQLKGASLSCFIQLADRNQAVPLQEKFRSTIDVPLQEKYSKESGHLLQALSDFHLKSEFGSHVLSQESSISYSLILAAISLMVMMIACFNFMNLSIGMASNRIKEIGVRKVLGAQKRHLLKQFWLESLIYSFFSLLIGLMIVELFMPAFNRLVQKNLGMDILSNAWAGLFSIGLVILAGIGAGSYPALFMSKFSSVDLFHGKTKLSRKNPFSRSLIVFQFSISIFLIVSTIFLYKQKNYMLHTNLGYDPDQIVVVHLKNFTSERQSNVSFIQTFKNRLLPYETITGVSGSAYDLSEGWMGTYFEKEGSEPSLVVYDYVDKDFIPTLGMKITAGRNFSDDFPSDMEGSIIINESLAEKLGTTSPVGHRLSEFFKTDFDREIIGIVEDFHSQSLHAPIYPAFIGMSGMNLDYVFIKFNTESIHDTVEGIKKEFEALAPEIPFNYSFLDETVARQYEREEHWIRMVEYASFFALIIACSGLMGLTLQVIYLRTKEIGIRKVLGASAHHILLLINREFLWFVLAANIIAWPCSYFVLSLILRNYAYRISLTPWIFLFSGLIAFCMAAFTVSIHTLQAVRTNPSDTLKYE